jgi:hypothetical protein
MISTEVAILAKRKRQRRTISDEDEALVNRGDNDRNMQSFVILQFLNSMVLEGCKLFGKGPSIRRGNVHRNRQQIVDWSNDLDDTMLNRQFRICRKDFSSVLHKIESGLQKDEIKAKKSSGSPVSPHIMLMITLRILAGAAYLDMIHYQIHADSVNDMVWDTVCKLHEKINNIKQPESEDECKKLAYQWCAVQMS